MSLPEKEYQGPSTEQLRSYARSFLANDRRYSRDWKKSNKQDREELVEVKVKSCQEYADRLSKQGYRPEEAWQLALEQEMFERD